MSSLRTHYCGLVTETLLGQTIHLCGWVHRRRDHGGVIFIDLRDYHGLVQIVCNPEQRAVFTQAEIVRHEFCLHVIGIVRARPAGTANPNLISGQIEVVAQTLEILNPSLTPPFQLDDEHLSETTRLTHRVLDLRRPQMQQHLRLRHRVTMAVRQFLDAEGFVDIETPMLTKSTPEGARDYLVPSRVNAGEFFALPQSPQLFKQLLMVANFDRYYQITKCFRDEDLRADRQPEFTQIDCELSFMSEQEIRHLFENMIRIVFNNILNVALPDPFPVMSYATALDKYGSDKPDLGVKLELTELTDIMHDVTFQVFANAAHTQGGRVVALRVPGGAREQTGIPRSEIDAYTQLVAIYGAKGLAYIKVNEQAQGRNGLQSPIIKHIHDTALTHILKRTGAEDGDLIFFGADQAKIVNDAMGALRIKIGHSEFGKKNGLFEAGWHPLWIVDFPMFDYDAEKQGWSALHHPFTAPKEDQTELLLSKPEAVIAQAYDLVLNGWELGGGSIRIHRADVQQQVFRVLQIDEHEARAKFGFLLDALQYGAPPHGGIAFGLDRLLAMMAGVQSIRDVIAFPKTQRAQCLLTEAPSVVDDKQLRELHIRLRHAVS